ncbi:unnamed protein product [Diamesa tonsa]
MIQSAGYQSEVHKVETEDGYILKVHRILVKKESLIPRKPVFMMHGIASTAIDYILSGPDIALGYLLSDNGYDVWLGNSRGNKYSMAHKTLDVEAKEFWNFSFHEIGYYDLPAMIDFMLKTTNQSRFFSVGFSQGSTTTLIVLATRPEYNQKIIQTHLMAPAAFLKHMTSPGVKTISTPAVKQLVKELGLFKNPPLQDLIKAFSDNVCKGPTFSLCQSCMFFIFGKSTGELEMDSVILMLLNVTPFLAIKQGLHFLQLYDSGHFRQYDYFADNSAHYNSSEPPDYNLSSIKVPVYIYRGEQDDFVSKLDIDKLKSLLPNVRSCQVIKHYNHMDLMYGKNARKLIYSNILKAMNSDKSL